MTGLDDATFDGVDFFRNRTLTVDPYPYFEHLRSQCPVVREPHHGVYMVTGYDEAISVYRDPATYSSCNTVSGPFVPFSVPVEGDDISAVIDAHRDELPFSDQLPSFDPPEHTAHRGLLMRLITPKRLKENEDVMWRLADRQLDQILDRRGCEFIGDFAQPFTLLVIADLLGVPEADHPLLKEKLLEVSSGIGKRHEAMAHKPLEFLYEQFTLYIEQRRASTRTSDARDVMGGIAAARFPDGSLPSVHDVALIAANLFTAGQETTARMLGFAVQVLAERPDVTARLRADRSLIPNFVEEVLRLESPLKCQFRMARHTTALDGHDVKAGETVLVLPGAANRDPRVFDDPAALRLDRPNSRQHLAFGHGIHTCAGAPLARAEGRVALERILDRMTDIRLSEEHHGPAGDRHVDYLPTFFMRAIESLHIEYTPAA